jgi:hypothetical protein
MKSEAEIRKTIQKIDEVLESYAPDGSVSVTLTEPAAVRPANSNGNGTAAPDPKTNEWDGVPA